jgi:hypothetical protein
LGDNQLIKRLFDEIAPRFASRNGGYTRVTKLGPEAATLPKWWYSNWLKNKEETSGAQPKATATG